MSQCFHIQLKASISRHVKSEDSVSYPIELTEILPAEEMKDILRGVAEQAGWEVNPENPDQFIKVGENGEITTLDLDKMEVTTVVTDEKQVSTEVSAGGSAWENEDIARVAAQQALREQSEAVGDMIEESARQDLKEQLRKKLEETEGDRMRGLNELLQQVYAESLKRKAGQLGEVLEVQESKDDDNYELVIRVSQ